MTHDMILTGMLAALVVGAALGRYWTVWSGAVPDRLDVWNEGYNAGWRDHRTAYGDVFAALRPLTEFRERIEREDSGDA